MNQYIYQSDQSVIRMGNQINQILIHVSIFNI